MKRTEIEFKIQWILEESRHLEINDQGFDEEIFDWYNARIRLTDLFIELSNGRCIQQKALCILDLDNMLQSITTHDEQLHAVLNAPFPEIH